MKGRDREYEKHNSEELQSKETDLQSRLYEYEIDFEDNEDEMSPIVWVDINNIRSALADIRHEIDYMDLNQVETSCFDNDNGKAVTTKGLKSNIEVPKVNYTNIHKDVYNELDDPISDQNNIFDENVFGDVMERLRNVNIKNKKDFNDQLERVYWQSQK